MDINLASSDTAAARIDVSSVPLKPPLQGVETENKPAIFPVQEVDKSLAAEKTVSQEKLEQVATGLSDMMSLMRKGLAFKVDDNSGVNVVSVMDIDSGDVIRQIPSEEALKLAEKLSEVTGFLMKTEA
ncbi:flagellar protein FlaG [Shewanella baltica]|uniref:flagellar protein FlaG n=1 Tax=Shewanella baltica TaxID=62322 RepID=UPI003D792190